MAAFPTAVNSQISDAVSQGDTKALGIAPAMALGNLYQATSQALSNAAHNATAAQQQAFVTAQAALVMGITTLYGSDTVDSAADTSALLGNLGDVG